MSHETKAQTPLDALYNTGFLPRSDRRSRWQYRSSVLAKTTPGPHTPRILARTLHAGRYEREIVNGFRKAWWCILGTPNRRAAFARRLRCLRALNRRWIYWSTRNYDAVRRASIQPAALRSGMERDLLIRKFCQRGASFAVIDEEVRSLKRFDVPYFTRRGAKVTVVDQAVIPRELIGALRQVRRV